MTVPLNLTLNTLHTYHNEFGAGTHDTRRIIHIDLIKTMLTGSTNLLITSLIRWRWTIILRWRTAPVIYESSASGKVSKTSLTTEHNCSSFIFAHVSRFPIFEDTVKLNSFRLCSTVLTKIPKYKATSLQDQYTPYRWAISSAATLRRGLRRLA